MNSAFSKEVVGPMYAPITMLIKATIIATRGAMCILK